MKRSEVWQPVQVIKHRIDRGDNQWQKKTELKAVSYVMIDETPVLWENLSTETRGECLKKMMENLGDTMSRYFSENPEEAEKLNLEGG